jgi:hypothetical protein
MKMNDLHLEQSKPPTEQELNVWKEAHQKARESLNRIGEFMHHEDYWHMHEHEMEDIVANYNPETAGAEMADSYNPQGDQLDEELTTKKTPKGHAVYYNGEHIGHVSSKKVPWIRGKTITKIEAENAAGESIPVESDSKGKNTVDSAKQTLLKHHLAKLKEEAELDEELTDKTIRSSDKIKVARVIADMLGVENAETMSPEQAISQGLRKIKNKRMTPELRRCSTLHRKLVSRSILH